VRVLLSGVALATIAILGSAVLGLQVGLRQNHAASPSESRGPDPAATAGTTAIRPGAWHVVSGSWIGYAIGETTLLGTTTVSGRTTDVGGQGNLSLAPGGFSLSGSTFSANLTTLASGDPFGDQQVQDALGTGRYPTAPFDQLASVSLPSAAALRTGVTVTIPGSISLHGVTHNVAVQAQVTFANGRLNVVGAIPFRLSGFGIDASALGGLVTISDAATLNLSVVLEHP
jgi:polyisoprenoid-binding protein YceI